MRWPAGGTRGRGRSMIGSRRTGTRWSGSPGSSASPERCWSRPAEPPQGRTRVSAAAGGYRTAAPRSVPGSRGLSSAATLTSRQPRFGLENEANLGAFAELWHGAAGQDFVHVSADAGIGGALVVGGMLLRGRRGFANRLILLAV